MGFGLHEYTLKQRVDEVELCIKHQMWQAALALALTIPDICGQIKFGGNVGERYRKWFHEYVEHRFADPKAWDNNGYAVNPYFTAAMCYKLRCAFLHSGDDDIEEKNLIFNLRINSIASVGLNDENENVSVSIDVAELCNYICEGALKFFNEWPQPQDFQDKKCCWVDIKEWNERIESHNSRC